MNYRPGTLQDLDPICSLIFAQKLYRHNGYEPRGYADWRKGRFDLMEKAI